MIVGHEAANAARCVNDFSQLKQTSVVVPEVLWAKRRVMAMECKLHFPLFPSPLLDAYSFVAIVCAVVKGGRVDDLDYLARHNIDRNEVSRQIAEITSRMIYITGLSSVLATHCV